MTKEAAACFEYADNISAVDLVGGHLAAAAE
jgi:hypothetical protein